VKAPRVASLAFLALAACSGGGLEPVPVPLDRAHCARCDMILSSDRNAAQAVSAAEDPLFYDDIGCLARDRRVPGPDTRLYVRGSGADGWLAVDSAWFARPPGADTPMGYGVLAYETAAAARAADREAEARSWADILREAEASP
jgi:copper chaperone NosL